jgi:omega-hydroxy-beta-dihydromenaquinone-9 sulfotransferase
MQPDDQGKCEIGSRRKWWQLRVWYGMTAAAWFSLLWRNRFSVAPSRLGICAVATGMSLFNSLLAWAQWALFSRRVERVALREDPIFVLGHWRSGTTLLHELLTLDPDHHSPSTYACLAPKHFLVSEKMLGWCLRFFLPSTRSQDDVAVGLAQPQEDEWAICTLGLPTLYQAVAFSGRLEQAQKYFILEDLQPLMREKWIACWMRFLKAVALQSRHKRLVLKSPLHTARIAMLLSKFPQAHFVHIARDPHAVHASTLRLWRRLAEDESLQAVDADAIEAFVQQNYEQLSDSYEVQASAIPPDRLYELRYEELVFDPIAAMRKLYEHWQLDDAGVNPLWVDYVKKMATFRTAKYPPLRGAPGGDIQLGDASNERDSCRQREVA